MSIHFSSLNWSRNLQVPSPKTPALWSQFAGMSRRPWILPGFIFSTITNELLILPNFKKKVGSSFKWNCLMVAASPRNRGDFYFSEKHQQRKCKSITPFHIVQNVLPICQKGSYVHACPVAVDVHDLYVHSLGSTKRNMLVTINIFGNSW